MMPKSIILDPFVGSGTTIRVAKRLGRHFIGIDVNEKSAELLGMQPNKNYDKPLDSLYIGDCLTVMKELYKRHGAFVDLIYADPPFGRNSVDKQFGINWNDYPVDIRLLSEMFGKPLLKTLKYERKAFLHWFYQRVVMMKKLLKDTGSIYIHCDPN